MFLELLRKRRSIRRFQSRSVEQEKVEYLVEAALRSPSSRSLNPWQFVVVDDPKMLEVLSRAKPHGAGFLKNAPLAIVVCADPQKCDVWVEDCSIAALLIHLAAADAGLGSCWIQIRLRQHESGATASSYVSDALGLEEGIEVEAIIAVGYPDEQKEGHSGEKLLFDRVVKYCG
ncbi:MAG: nitroreductase family protein [Desulfopila sp.]|jgi:nitroreductase|nr:nitroreductase family protein [Desulfopila sp.]